MTPARSPITWWTIRSTRRVISVAARLEKVIRRIRRGSAPLTIRCATRSASVFVLPEPAPAITRSGAQGAQSSPGRHARRLVAVGIELVEIGDGHGLRIVQDVVARRSMFLFCSQRAPEAASNVGASALLGYHRPAAGDGDRDEERLGPWLARSGLSSPPGPNLDDQLPLRVSATKPGS